MTSSAGSPVQVIAVLAVLPCGIANIVLDLYVMIPIVRGENPPTRRWVAAVVLTLVMSVLLYIG